MHSHRSFPRGLASLVFAIKNKTVHDHLKIIHSFHHGWFRKTISNHSIQRAAFKKVNVNLKNKNISSLIDWDFSHQQIEILDLSDNQLSKIDDDQTDFGVIHTLHLKRNKIKEIDLRNSKFNALHLEDNNINDSLFCCKHLQLSERMQYLYLESNPIKKLSNFDFTPAMSPFSVLYLDNCDIVTLENIVFNSEYVYLNSNPLSIIKNVTFRNVRFVSMWNCHITLKIFKTWQNEITFKSNSGRGIEWALFQNPIHRADLKHIDYQLPIGVETIMLEGGDYYGPVWL